MSRFSTGSGSDSPARRATTVDPLAALRCELLLCMRIGTNSCRLQAFALAMRFAYNP